MEVLCFFFFFFVRSLCSYQPNLEKAKMAHKLKWSNLKGVTFGHRDEPKQSEEISEMISEILPDFSAMQVKP